MMSFVKRSLKTIIFGTGFVLSCVLGAAALSDAVAAEPEERVRVSVKLVEAEISDLDIVQYSRGISHGWESTSLGESADYNITTSVEEFEQRELYATIKALEHYNRKNMEHYFLTEYASPAHVSFAKFLLYLTEINRAKVLTLCHVDLTSDGKKAIYDDTREIDILDLTAGGIQTKVDSEVLLPSGTTLASTREWQLIQGERSNVGSHLEARVSEIRKGWYSVTYDFWHVMPSACAIKSKDGAIVIRCRPHVGPRILDVNTHPISFGLCVDGTTYHSKRALTSRDIMEVLVRAGASGVCAPVTITPGYSIVSAKEIAFDEKTRKADFILIIIEGTPDRKMPGQLPS